MASGYGYHGGQSRCYAYFRQFQQCFADNQGSPGSCKHKAEDYIECLHHYKEHARQLVVKAQYEKQAAEASRDDQELAKALRTGTMQVGLGLIKKAREGKESGEPKDS